MEKLIEYYFLKDYNYEDILLLLLKKHNIDISMSTLKRILRNLNLKRKGFEESNEDDLIAAVLNELEGSGSDVGYRTMHQKLKCHNQRQSQIPPIHLKPQQ